MTNQDIFEFLDQCYPCETALPFDNPGFLVGDRQKTVGRVLVALDCSLSAIREAKARGCTLIVSHHPVIWDPLKSVTDSSPVFAAISAGIAVISMHTNLDIGDGGVNDCLAEAVGLKEITPYRMRDGFLTRIGTTDPVSADDFAKRLRAALGGGIKYTAGAGLIRKVLLCGGSGGEYLDELAEAECDALVTADVKHHLFVEAENRGAALFDAGHFETEDPVTERLAALLRSQFKELAVETFHPQFLHYC